LGDKTPKRKKMHATKEIKEFCEWDIREEFFLNYLCPYVL